MIRAIRARVKSDQRYAWRKLVLCGAVGRRAWPQILTPLGPFFGFDWETAEYGSVIAGCRDGQAYQYLPHALPQVGQALAQELPREAGHGRIRDRVGAAGAVARRLDLFLCPLASRARLEDLRLPVPGDGGARALRRRVDAHRPSAGRLVGRGRREGVGGRRRLPALDRHGLRGLFRRRLGHPLPVRPELRRLFDARATAPATTAGTSWTSSPSRSGCG